MAGKLDGRVPLVTGGAQGVGAASAPAVIAFLSSPGSDSGLLTGQMTCATGSSAA